MDGRFAPQAQKQTGQTYQDGFEGHFLEFLLRLYKRLPKASTIRSPANSGPADSSRRAMVPKRHVGRQCLAKEKHGPDERVAFPTGELAHSPIAWLGIFLMAKQ